MWLNLNRLRDGYPRASFFRERQRGRERYKGAPGLPALSPSRPHCLCVGLPFCGQACEHSCGSWCTRRRRRRFAYPSDYCRTMAGEAATATVSWRRLERETESSSELAPSLSLSRALLTLFPCVSVYRTNFCQVSPCVIFIYACKGRRERQGSSLALSFALSLKPTKKGGGKGRCRCRVEGCGGGDGGEGGGGGKERENGRRNEKESTKDGKLSCQSASQPVSLTMWI